MNWQQLTSLKELEAIQVLSHNPKLLGVLIFKHSTRCATSSVALDRMERNWKVSDEQIPSYYLDLLRHRDISNGIAATYDVVHESPQVLVIKNGECIYSASHNSISSITIVEVLGLR